MRNKKDKKSIKTYKMTMSFKLNHADSPPLLNSTVSKLLLFLSPLRFHVLLHQGLCLINFALFKSITKASNKPFSRVTRFYPGSFAPKHLHNPSQLLVFDLARNVPNRLKH